MGDPEESLRYPRPEDQAELPEDRMEISADGPNWEQLPEAKDLTNEQIYRLLSGVDFDPFMDPEDLREVLLRRQHEAQEMNDLLKFLLPLSVVAVVVFAFFGWKLYKSLKERQMKREEKKRLKQKKKK